MYKYHKDIGFKPADILKAQALIEYLKNRPVKFSKHSSIELSREDKAYLIAQTIKDYILNFNDVFEIVINNDNIEKLGFRIPYNYKDDIIFILSKDKIIITCWINSKEDKHYTLRQNKYYKP